jgi:hemoglobin
MKTTATILTLALAVGAATHLTACGSSNKSSSATKSASKAAAKAPGKSLYTRLGGEPAITAVVNDFVNNSAADPTINFTRKGEGKEWNATPEAVAHLKKMLVEQICQATGGPQKYTGRDMKTVHKGQNITEAQFNALAAQLVMSLKRFKVADADSAELVAIVASMKGDIVGQ